MAFTLPSLPFSKSALEPIISAETLEYHYGKHHQAYVNNLNGLAEGKPEANMALEDIIMKAEGGVFNNAAQVWNHTFYWHSLKHNGGGKPSGRLAIRHSPSTRSKVSSAVAVSPVGAET